MPIFLNALYGRKIGITIMIKIILVRDPDKPRCSKGIPLDDQWNRGRAVALCAPGHRLTQPEHTSTENYNVFFLLQV